LKILQIVTLITPDGAYGGPVRVAVNQTRALLAEGHDVILAAGARGFGKQLPRTFDNVPVLLFDAATILPRLGFAGLHSRGLHRWLHREAPTADVVHIHMGRDLITLPSASIAQHHGVPYVLQTHGMIVSSTNMLAGPVDALWTKSALRNASRVFHLTPEEEAGLREVGGPQVRLEDLGNGVPLPQCRDTEERGIEVLFLARLHLRKRPLFFVELAKKLHSRFPHVRFSLVGPDEGQGKDVLAAIADAGMAKTIAWEGPIAPDAVTERLSKCSIYVLPSINEPFPMSVLEAMAMGKPVVVSDSCGIAEVISEAQAGFAVDETVESLTDAVAKLLASSSLRREAGEKAHLLAQQRFGMAPVVKQLTQTYEDVIGDHA
jgi:glycosyltransferase involved in cell wall biosynthesis